MSEPQAAEALQYDLTDRLNKALRIGKCKPGEMRMLLGVSESTMTNYLNGTTRPKDGFLRQWASRCGRPVTFDWLRYGIAEPDDGPEGLPGSHLACNGNVVPFGPRGVAPLAVAA